MPHKVGKKWKWGNIERKSKEDLRKIVYGIWMKNGSKGNFSKFWKTGKVDESGTSAIADLLFKRVPKDSLLQLLDEIEEYNENKLFKREQFEKYLSSNKMIDSEEKSMYYGLFNVEGQCFALSYLNKVPDGCVLIAQISCIMHGYGRLLIEEIISKSNAVWLAVDPTASESLLEYYRTFNLEEIALDYSKWADGKEEHFFLKADGDNREKIISTIQNASSMKGHND